MTISPIEIKQFIQAEAYNLGFCLVGFTGPSRVQPSAHFIDWIDQGFHAGMSYLAKEENIHARYHVEEFFPSARTIISLAAAFPKPDETSSGTLPPTIGRIASYATGMDYHEVLRQKHAQLIQAVQQKYQVSFEWKSAVDANPLPEREIAVSAGLGWIARNGMLTSLTYGSLLFLSEIFLELAIPFDDVFSTAHCGNCTRCLDACPTQCILSDRTLDANKCLSYLSIEHRGDIPVQFHEIMGDRIFGCDICLSVCPWNTKQIPVIMPEFVSDTNKVGFDIEKNLPDLLHHFGSFFHHSAVQRAGKSGFLRNCLIRLSNAQHPSADELSKQIQEFMR